MGGEENVLRFVRISDVGVSVDVPVSARPQTASLDFTFCRNAANSAGLTVSFTRSSQFRPGATGPNRLQPERQLKSRMSPFYARSKSRVRECCMHESVRGGAPGNQRPFTANESCVRATDVPIAPNTPDLGQYSNVTVPAPGALRSPSFAFSEQILLSVRESNRCEIPIPNATGNNLTPVWSHSYTLNRLR
jgi:hypothetical protein